MEMGRDMENFTEQNNSIWFVVSKVSYIFQKFLILMNNIFFLLKYREREKKKVSEREMMGR